MKKRKTEKLNWSFFYEKFDVRVRIGQFAWEEGDQ